MCSTTVTSSLTVTVSMGWKSSSFSTLPPWHPPAQAMQQKMGTMKQQKIKNPAIEPPAYPELL